MCVDGKNALFPLVPEIGLQFSQTASVRLDGPERNFSSPRIGCYVAGNKIAHVDRGLSRHQAESRCQQRSSLALLGIAAVAFHGAASGGLFFPSCLKA